MSIKLAGLNLRVPTTAALGIAVVVGALLGTGASVYALSSNLTTEFDLTAHFKDSGQSVSNHILYVPMSTDATATMNGQPSNPVSWQSNANIKVTFDYANPKVSYGTPATVTITSGVNKDITQTFTNVIYYVIGTADVAKATPPVGNEMITPISSGAVIQSVPPPPPYCFYNSSGQYICL